MSRLSRNKGRKFEQEIAARFRKYFPHARRHLEFQTGEANGVDISNTDPFKIQCKKTHKYVSINTIKEIQCERLFGDIPLLITEADHDKAMVVLHLEDFMTLLGDALKACK